MSPPFQTVEEWLAGIFIRTMVRRANGTLEINFHDGKPLRGRTFFRCAAEEYLNEAQKKSENQLTDSENGGSGKQDS